MTNNLEVTLIEKQPEDFYFKPRFFEKKGRVYEFAGTRLFKKAFLKILREKRDPNGNNYYIGSDHSNDSLMKYEEETRFNESHHLIQGLVLIGTTSLMAYLGAGSLLERTTESLGAAAVLLNIYLVMTQRYNRARIYNILENRRGKI